MVDREAEVRGRAPLRRVVLAQFDYAAQYDYRSHKGHLDFDDGARAAMSH